MILTLILKEIKFNLLNIRFVVSLLFILIVYTGCSIIFSKKFLNELEKDRFNERLYLSDLEKGRNGLQALYEENIILTKNQVLSSIFASGNENRFPKSFAISPCAPQGASISGSMVGGYTSKNYKVENLMDFDFTFIIGIVLSFFIIVLSFDSISRDREGGTLKQQLSNTVPRVYILISKYGAILALLFITTLVGLLVSILILQILVGTNIFISFPLQTILSGIFAIIYLSAFVWLGLWISASVSNSSTSLALLLLIWISLVILTPYIGGMIVQRYYPIASPQKNYQMWRTLMSTTSRERPDEYHELYEGKDNEEGWRKVERFNERQNKAFEQFVTQRFMELTNQAMRAEKFNFFSPYGAYKQAMEKITNTGLEYHIKYFHAVRNYRDDLVKFIREQDRQDPYSKHRIALEPKIRSMSNKPVDPAVIPRFNTPSRDVSTSDIEKALPPISYLLVLNIIFFILAHFTFQRMDVR